MKNNTWEYRVYQNQEAFDNRISTVISSGYTSKKDCIYEAKHTVKKLKFDAPIVKIQDQDSDVIEIYNAVNKYGVIIFKKHS